MMSRWSTRVWRRAVKLAQLAALVTLSVMLISPLRDALLFPVFPTAWRTHPSHRLVRMLMDNQHFDIPEPFAHQYEDLSNVTPSLTVNLKDVSMFQSKEDPYSEFYRQRDALKARVGRGEGGQAAMEELAMVESFKPVMNQTERAQLLFTLDVFVRACRQYGLTFFLFEGSLLGSYRHHGLIPWDDDVDLALNASQWRVARRVLGSIPGFTLYAPSDTQWKFYLSSLPPFHDKPFKWPNLDLFFFSQQDPYVWGLTWGVKNHLLMHVKHMLPLSTVPWEGMELPAPACATRYLENSYGQDGTCVTPTYVHKTNQERYAFQTGAVDCARLHKYFPFVFRSSDSGAEGNSVASVGGEGGVVTMVETLKVGHRIISQRNVPYPPDECVE